jgi:ADP-ribose pyrophosphatase
MPRTNKPSEQPLADAPAGVTVVGREVLGRGFRAYERLRFTQDSGAVQARDVLRSGAVAAVLPLDIDRDEVVLLRQLRLPAHLAGAPAEMVEIVAGHVEAGEEPRATAQRECVEEIGVEPRRMIELLSYFTSPGMTDEQVTLFLGLVDAAGVPERAGLASEHEQTAPMRVSIDTALDALAASRMRNGPLLVALQWLALNRARLREIAGADRG